MPFTIWWFVDVGHSAGIVAPDRWLAFLSDRDAIQRGTDLLSNVVLSPQVRIVPSLPDSFHLSWLRVGGDMELILDEMAS
jgi:hypothetical protein